MRPNTKFLNSVGLKLYLASPAILHISESVLHLNQLYLHSNLLTINGAPNIACRVAHNDETFEVPVYPSKNPVLTILNISEATIILYEHDPLERLALKLLINPSDYIKHISVACSILKPLRLISYIGILDRTQHATCIHKAYDLTS